MYMYTYIYEHSYNRTAEHCTGVPPSAVQHELTILVVRSGLGDRFDTLLDCILSLFPSSLPVLQHLALLFSNILVLSIGV